MPPISVVIIDSDTVAANSMVKYIKNLGDHATVEGVATNFEHGFELIHKKKPLVVIMDICTDTLDVAIERIGAVLNRFPQTNIFAACSDKSSDTILKVMRAGATEYLLKPVAEVDLVSALQKLGRLWLVRPSPEAEMEMGRVYTVFSPKGGVGVTTLAINIATNIYEVTKKPTVLVDLDLYAGDVTTFLNLRPSYTISDVTANLSRLDKNFLQGVITKHESGIYVLAAPQKVEDGVSISGDATKKVLNLLKTMFSYVIIDTESSLSAVTMTAMELSDMILLVFVMSLPGIKNVQRFLNHVEKVGLKNKLHLVVNRYLKKGDIKIEDAEKILKQTIFWSVTNEYDTGKACLNKGEPLSICDPESRLNIDIRDLATKLANLK
ncbi:MAG TPA: AAA family ATPase [Thermodesulfovibrionales bacterium]|nr:AAA family ATPase [Thermodesulfovibrionales bacterium]